MNVIITGMHRSGTSAIAGVINFLGFDFGSLEGAMGASEENPTGFWEQYSVMKVNDRILQQMGYSWNQLSSVKNLSKFNKLENMPISGEINSCISTLFSQDVSYFVKDPRFCITYPVWKKSLPSPPLIVFVFRDPYEVALSLQTRNGFPISFGLALWFRYNQSAMSFLSNEKHVLVNYNELMKNPEEVVKVMTELVGKHSIKKLKSPSQNDIEKLISTKYYRSKKRTHKTESLEGIDEMYASMVSGNIDSFKESKVITKTLKEHEELVGKSEAYLEIERLIASEGNLSIEKDSVKRLIRLGLNATSIEISNPGLEKKLRVTLSKLETSRQVVIKKDESIKKKDDHVAGLREQLKNFQSRVETQRLRNEALLARVSKNEETIKKQNEKLNEQMGRLRKFEVELDGLQNNLRMEKEENRKLTENLNSYKDTLNSEISKSTSLRNSLLEKQSEIELIKSKLLINRIKKILGMKVS